MPPYILKNSLKSKRITIRIKSDGIVVVSKPKSITIKQVEDFIFQKREWIKKHLDDINSRPKIVREKISKEDFDAYRTQALKIVREKMEIFNKHYNFTYGKVTIRDQKTRWGSCSKKGNINFNYKLALIPERLVDYVVVHELCHLGEFSHSLKFWNLVEEMIPDYIDRRKELKKIRL